ncbi:MAG: hypothetical protein ABR928_10795 [Terracidiphilus sp.]|jgi:hypothetical protein
MHEANDNNSNCTHDQARRIDKPNDAAVPECAGNWKDIFTSLDTADFPAEFMGERDQGIAEEREPPVSWSRRVNNAGIGQAVSTTATWSR